MKILQRRYLPISHIRIYIYVIRRSFAINIFFHATLSTVSGSIYIPVSTITAMNEVVDTGPGEEETACNSYIYSIMNETVTSVDHLSVM